MPAETRQPIAGQHRFTVTFRGYKPAEVDQVVAELNDQVENLVGDLDRLSREKQQLSARLLSAINQANTLSAQVKHLSASAGSADGLSERIRAILGLASAEADTITAHATAILEQTKSSQADLDQRRARFDVERSQLIASAQAEAERMREEAQQAARAHRAETDTEAERILAEARTTARAAVEEAHRAAAADVDRLHEHLRATLPSALDAIIKDAIALLPSRVDGAPTADNEAVVLPEQRRPVTKPTLTPRKS
jgi:DivIVA domain-containing protein